MSHWSSRSLGMKVSLCLGLSVALTRQTYPKTSLGSGLSSPHLMLAGSGAISLLFQAPEAEKAPENGTCAPELWAAAQVQCCPVGRQLMGSTEPGSTAGLSRGSGPAGERTRFPDCPSALSVTSQRWGMLPAPPHTPYQNLFANQCPTAASWVAEGSTVPALILNALGGGCRCSCDTEVPSTALQSLPWKVG